MFKVIISAVCSFFASVSLARHAADLARNHQYERAKEVIQGN